MKTITVELNVYDTCHLLVALMDYKAFCCEHVKAIKAATGPYNPSASAVHWQVFADEADALRKRILAQSEETFDESDVE